MQLQCTLRKLYKYFNSHQRSQVNDHSHSDVHQFSGACLHEVFSHFLDRTFYKTHITD